MIAHYEVVQQSDEWWELRNGKPTASEFSRILNPTAGQAWVCVAPSGSTCGVKHRDEEVSRQCCTKHNKTVHEDQFRRVVKRAPFELADKHMTYAAQIVAERLAGGPEDRQEPYQDPNIIRGIVQEPAIVAFYQYHYPGSEIRLCGFVEHDSRRFGCSPDAIVFQDGVPVGGIEVKAPTIETLIGWHRDGGIPTEHKVQVQGGLVCSGLKFWDFLAVNRTIAHKPLLGRQEPDAFTAELEKAVLKFCDVCDELEKEYR